MYVSACIKFSDVSLAKASYTAKSSVSGKKPCQRETCNVQAISAVSLHWIRPGCKGVSMDGLVLDRGLGRGVDQMP